MCIYNIDESACICGSHVRYCECEIVSVGERIEKEDLFSKYICSSRRHDQRSLQMCARLRCEAHLVRDNELVKVYKYS